MINPTPDDLGKCVRYSTENHDQPLGKLLAVAGSIAVVSFGFDGQAMVMLRDLEWDEREKR